MKSVHGFTSKRRHATALMRVPWQFTGGSLVAHRCCPLPLTCIRRGVASASRYGSLRFACVFEQILPFDPIVSIASFAVIPHSTRSTLQLQLQRRKLMRRRSKSWTLNFTLTMEDVED